MIYIVIPCYNEASRWDSDYWTLMMSIENVYWIFVDDGSIDHTCELARHSCELVPGAGEVLSLSVNAGKAEAVRLGMRRSMDLQANIPGLIGFMDADGAFSVEDVQNFIAVGMELCWDKQTYDSIWASRVALAGREINRTALRHYLGRAVATVLSIGDKKLPYDTQAGLKLFLPSVILRQVVEFPFSTRWLFEMEMWNRWWECSESPMRIWEIPLTSWSDIPGSRITASQSIKIGRDLIRIKKQQIAVNKVK